MSETQPCRSSCAADCSIADPSLLWADHPDYLRPFGLALAIFFLNPWDAEDELPEGGGPPFGVTKAELDNLFNPHFSLAEEFKPKTAFPGREGREIIRLLRKRPY